MASLRWVTRNWGLKVSALLLALLFWALVRSESVARRQIAGVPVEVELRDADWRLARPPQPGSVEVTVTGPWRELLQLQGENTRVTVPIENVTDTTELRVLSTNWVNLDEDGGRVRIGGAFQGGGELPAANRVDIDSASVVHADALQVVTQKAHRFPDRKVVSRQKVIFHDGLFGHIQRHQQDGHRDTGSVFAGQAMHETGVAAGSRQVFQQL